MPDYISKITLPNGSEYLIKDSEARAMIAEIVAAGLTFKISTDEGTTPAGITWKDGDTTITGNLQPRASTRSSVYLVPHQKTAGAVDYYREYVTVQTAGGETSSSGDDQYIWEYLGNTDIDLSDLGDLIHYDDVQVTLNKGSGDNVLGVSTTFTASQSAVTFTGDSSDTFVKSYPGVSSKLETKSITGVGGNITFTAIDSATDYTATDTVFGTDIEASLIEPETKTVHDLIPGTDKTASYVSGTTTKTFALAASSATDVSYIGNASTASILEGASVSNENLTFSSATVTQASVTGINGTNTVVDYTFSTVGVPAFTSATTVSIAGIKTITSITVPVVSSNTQRTMTKVVTASKTAATAAAAATTVATGSLKADDAVGATIMTGLGSATTASAITGLGSATAAAQTINVGTNDQVKVAVYGDLSTSVTLVTHTHSNS